MVPPATSGTQGHPWGQAVTWSSRTISVLQQLPCAWAIHTGLCGNNFNSGCSQQNQPHATMRTSRDSPYFSLKSSFTCSRRITFSPSLLASSSSAKARKNRGELNLFPSEPLENQSHWHNAGQDPCPSAPAWPGDTSEVQHLSEFCRVALKCCQPPFAMCCHSYEHFISILQGWR